jgi:hypothetical protein
LPQFLGIDIDIVKHDQLIASAIGVHDPVIVSCPGECVHDNRGKSDVSPLGLELAHCSPDAGDVQLIQTVGGLLTPRRRQLVKVGSADFQERPSSLRRLTTSPDSFQRLDYGLDLTSHGLDLYRTARAHRPCVWLIATGILETVNKDCARRFRAAIGWRHHAIAPVGAPGNTRRSRRL